MLIFVMEWKLFESPVGKVRSYENYVIGSRILIAAI
jgi:hypothetical protein